MRAALLRDMNYFEVRELEKMVPGPTDVLIKVKAAGICDSDIHKMQRKWSDPLPMVMGHEIAGVVEEVGLAVEKIQAGDRVVVVPLIPCHNCPYCQAGRHQLCEAATMIGSQRYGGFAEYMTVPEKNVLKIDRKISFEEAAMIEPLAVAAHAVMGLKVQLGDTVAVFCMGTVGILSVQWLRLAGAKKIIGIDSNQNKLADALAYGLTDTIHATGETLKEQILKLTNGLGVDSALECTGSVVNREQCLLVTKKDGRIGYQGMADSDVSIRQRIFENILLREYSIVGLKNPYSAPFPGKEWQQAIDFLMQGRIEVNRLISHRFSLEDIQAAFKLAVQRNKSYQKIMILPGK